MKAKFTPTHNNYFAQLSKCIGHEFEFKYLSTVSGVMKFEPIDPNFPSSNPVPESDLEFVDGFPESTRRMFAAGWDLYEGETPPDQETLKNFDFCEMNLIIFKREKNATR